MKATLRKVLRRLLLPCFLAITILALSSPIGTVFFSAPPATARWEVAPPAQFHLGEVIQATLVVTTVPGVSLDISRLPDVGQTLTLANKIDPLPDSSSYDAPSTIYEGEVEVVAREVISYPQGGMIITQVSYEFIYLLEIDQEAPADDKRFPLYIALSQEHLLLRDGKLRRIVQSIFADSTEFLIVPRVDGSGSSVPIFQFFSFNPPLSIWPYLKLAGFGSLGLAICLIIRRALAIIPKRPSSQVRTENRPPAAQDLFGVWCKKPDQTAFIEAVKLYRAGVWGQPRTTPESLRLWVITTFVLYSGVELNHDQARSVFAQLVEVTNDPA